MIRLCSFGIVFVLFSVVRLGTASADSNASSKRTAVLNRDIELLLRTPLPNEPQSILGVKQNKVEQCLGRKITSIKAVSPLAGFDPASDLDIPTGSILTRALARQIVLNLWETGKYRDIQVSAKNVGNNGVDIYLRFEPMFRTTRLLLSGNKALEDAEVKRALGFTPGGTIVPDSESMIALRDRLVEEYGKRGYNDASASIRLETTDVIAEVVLIVQVDEGEPDRYIDVRINGLKGDLKKEQLLRVSGLKTGIVRDTISVQEGLEKLNRTLFELGYPDAKILDDYFETKIRDHLYRLTINVDVGIKTLLDFKGNTRIRSSRLKELVWREGFQSNERAVLNAAAKIRQYAVGRGLFHAKVYPFRRCYAHLDKWYTVSVNHKCDRKEVTYQNIVFEINEGPQVEVEDILIMGASNFSARYLREETYAYMAEENKEDVVFEGFSTQLANELVVARADSKAAQSYVGFRALIEKPETIYDPTKYLEVTGHIEDLYAEQGYLDAKVTDTCVIENRPPISRQGRKFYPVPYQRKTNSGNLLTPCLYIDKELKGIIVEFTVEEGVQTRISRLEIIGNSPEVFTSATLLEIGKLQLNQPYNEYNIRDAATEIRNAYQEAGYMFADVTWETTISMDQTAANVRLSVIEGPKVHVNQIVINSEITNKWFIQNNLGFEPGDVVTPSMLSGARQRIMDIGVFNAATVQMKSPGIASEKKNIVVTVVERKSQYLELRAGAATEDGLRAGFEYGHRNIFGMAISYRLKLRTNYRHKDVWFFSSEAQEFKDDLIARYATYNSTHDAILASTFKWLEWYILTGFRTTNIPGTSGLLGAGVDVAFENVNRRGYSALKITPKFRLTSHYLRFLPIELSTGVDGTIVLPSQLENSRILNTSYSRLPSGRAVFWVTGLSISLDFRDNPLDPRKGFLLTLKGDYVHSLDKYTERQEENVIRKSRYVRFMGSVSGYIPLRKKYTVLALSTSVGYIFHLIDNSIAWADRHFYMGGVSTLRGFKSDTLSPQDVTLVTNDKGKIIQDYGGQAMALVRAELRHEFGKNIVGVVFGEAGNLWRDERNFLRKKGSGAFAPFTLRPVAGVGLHYNTPVGPLAFDVGFNLDKKHYESLWAWYFSIGSAF